MKTRARALRGRVPCDRWSCRVGFGLLLATYAADLTVGLVWHRTWAPVEIHGDILHGAVAMISVGVLSHLSRMRAESFAPIREAFRHGYQKAKEDMAEAAWNPDTGRVLHLPPPTVADSVVRAPGGGPSGGHLPTPRTYGKHARPTPSRPGS